MKAIKTTYHGPTNFKGSRIIASDSSGNRVSLSFDHSLGDYERNERAAYALCEKMGWAGQLIGGSLDADTMVWVFVPPSMADLNKGGRVTCRNDLAGNRAGE